ncbi:uncharacterized protein TNCV_4071561 [Trichonephila clavipes]|uniref:Uncharacterized protein n=1 Tax=Trichonephila clavipes TaxID=2585209 RepID=A0A8X6W7P1_TRICX|nr:uncharacterized protein TNCV_4071561 [Trichonephila clavipes]
MRPSWSHKFKRDSSEKTTWSKSACQVLCSSAHCRRSRRCRRRRIDETDVSTHVVVDKRAANCLEKAVRSFTAMRNRCRSSFSDVTFRHPRPVFQVVRCSSIHCFQTRITVELFRCTRAPIA